MPIITINNSVNNKYQNGGSFSGKWNILPFNPTSGSVNNVGPRSQFVNAPTQVMGLVPIFNCTEDCREGKYLADDFPDDTKMLLPVFAQNVSVTTDYYSNDYNTWVFSYPINVTGPLNDFKLQKLESGIWVTVAILNNSNYGTYLNYQCYNVNYQGYQILWNKVMFLQGAGTYRFYVSGSYQLELPYCAASPPFCLSLYSCTATNGTVKFTSLNSGGTRGSATQQGINWSLCCQPANENCLNIPITETGNPSGRINITFYDPLGNPYTVSLGFGPSQTATQIVANMVSNFNTLGLNIPGVVASQNTNGIFTVCIPQNYIGSKLNITFYGVTGGTITTPFGSPVNLPFPNVVTTSGLSWNDSIRFGGFFGRQTNDFQRDFIKYQTGQINKVRDEMTKKFELWVSPMPQWFYDCFSGYGLQADYLYVNDYNLNNANYNLKNFYIVADSSIEPEHRFESRYARISGGCKFKEGIQSVFADRCC